MSIIELMQFKLLIFKTEFTQQRSGMVSTVEISGEDMAHFLLIPKECPDSAIVHGQNRDTNEFDRCPNYKRMARELYLKYIQTGGPYEINV